MTKNTVKTAKTIAPALLANVRKHASANVVAFNDLCAAIRKAGGTEQDEVRMAVIEGAMLGSLYKGEETVDTLTKVRKALANVGHTAKNKPKAGQGRRTKAEEAAYASARQVWSRLLKKLAVKSANGSAGNQNAKGANKRKEETAAPAVAPIVAAPQAPAIPQAKTNADCVAFLSQQAAMLLSFANKNAKAMPIEARNAVGAFMQAIKALAPVEAKDGE